MRLTSAKEEEESALSDATEKASTFMNVVRRGEWDGSRVETRHSVDQLEHKVGWFVDLFAVDTRCRLIDC